MRDVEIVITDQTRPLTQAGFGLPLVLGTGKDQAYQEVSSLTELEGFDATDEVYQAVASILRQSPRPQTVAVYSSARSEAAPGDLAAALNALVGTHNNWYWLVFAPREHETPGGEYGTHDLVALAAWAASNGKMFVCTNEQQETAAEVVASVQALTASMETGRTVFIAHTDPGATSAYPDAALVGRLAPETPGTVTFKFKTLDGVAEAGFSTTEINALHEANAITYVNKFGVLQTSEGVATDGTYADIQLAKDWLKARMEERISRTLFVNGKIPYDNLGIGLIIEPIKAVLQEATRNGLIARDDFGNGLYTVTAPRRQDIAATDRANRILPDVYWDAELAGAVHKVQVTGVVRV
ncbi:MAG: DUF3383 domain-containing protein [Firmicutes bacterium]|nr:DUF3383 domain-containing protein [Bacillota bacterium]